MKRINVFRFLLMTTLVSIMLITFTFASTYSTANTGTSQGYSVTARANWDYITGNFVSKGPHTINSKPANTLTQIYDLEYLLLHQTSNLRVTQYFRPAYYNTLGGNWTYGSSFE